jgi:hypothetical protein
MQVGHIERLSYKLLASLMTLMTTENDQVLERQTEQHVVNKGCSSHFEPPPPPTAKCSDRFLYNFIRVHLGLNSVKLTASKHHAMQNTNLSKAQRILNLRIKRRRAVSLALRPLYS